jgi:hypothetical protein
MLPEWLMYFVMIVVVTSMLATIKLMKKRTPMKIVKMLLADHSAVVAAKQLFQCSFGLFFVEGVRMISDKADLPLAVLDECNLTNINKLRGFQS